MNRVTESVRSRRELDLTLSQKDEDDELSRMGESYGRRPHNEIDAGCREGLGMQRSIRRVRA